jgi:pimeloyl-ACP methyl ester carboxylesterase
MLGLIECIADIRRLGVRSELILGKRWQALTTPTLVVWGERDAFGSPVEGEALAAANPTFASFGLPGKGTFQEVSPR